VKRIQTAEDIGMNAYQILGHLLLRDLTLYSDEEATRILDWFSSALEGRPIGDLQTHRTPLPKFEGEPVHDIGE